MGQAGVVARALGLRPWADRAALVAYQEELLRRLVAHAYDRVLHYREAFDRHRVRPGDIRALADLARLPVASKEELREEPTERLLAAGADPRRLRRIQTSGSTGQPFVIHRGPLEKWRHQLFWLRAQRSVGHRLGERVARIVAVRGARDPARFDPVGRLTTFAGLRNHMLDVGRPPAELLRELAALRPAIVGGYPGMLAMLGEELGRAVPAAVPRPRLIATGGEVLTAARHGQIEAAWGAPVYEVYACHEANLLGWQCRATGGFHVCDDSVILEVLRDGRPVAPGESGEVVLTSLHATAMPLIRYRLADLATRGEAPCPCGQPFGTILRVQGRMLDLFRLRDGRLLHPYAILGDLKHDAFRWVRHYQLVQEGEGAVVFRMVPGAEFALSRLVEFERRAAAVLGDGARLRTELVDRIELGPGGKFRMASSAVADAGDSAAWHRAGA